MFGIFKKKSQLVVLQANYEQLMKSAYELSHSNRKLSDQKYAEAEEVSNQIQALKNQAR
jgi:uncharacterized protein Yka (UPF0111/DUF47 family)